MKEINKVLCNSAVGRLNSNIKNKDMKGVLSVILFLILYITSVQAQELTPQEGFSFPLGCRVKIKLDTTDISNIRYSVLSIEAYTEIIDTLEPKDLLPDNIDGDAVEFIFGVGTYGKAEDKKYRVLLLLRSGAGKVLNYQAYIKYKGAEDFKPTSVIPLYPGVLTKEIWQDAISEIALYGFSFRDMDE